MTAAAQKTISELFFMMVLDENDLEHSNGKAVCMRCGIKQPDGTEIYRSKDGRNDIRCRPCILYIYARKNP